MPFHIVRGDLIPRQTSPGKGREVLETDDVDNLRLIRVITDIMLAFGPGVELVGIALLVSEEIVECVIVVDFENVLVDQARVGIELVLRDAQMRSHLVGDGLPGIAHDRPRHVHGVRGSGGPLLKRSIDRPAADLEFMTIGAGGRGPDNIIVLKPGIEAGLGRRSCGKLGKSESDEEGCELHGDSMAGFFLLVWLELFANIIGFLSVKCY